MFTEHFTSFGFNCHLVDNIDKLCELPQTVPFVIAELSEAAEENYEQIKRANARFKIAVCRLRSANEIRTETGIDAIVSRHVKRDSLRNIVKQLLQADGIQLTAQQIT